MRCFAHCRPRIRLCLSVLAVACFPVSFIHGEGAEPIGKARWFQAHVFQSLALDEVPCPDSFRALKSSGDLQFKALGGWTTIGGGWRMRRYAVRQFHPLWILFNEAGGGVALIIGHQRGTCDPESEEERRGGGLPVAVSFIGFVRWAVSH